MRKRVTAAFLAFVLACLGGCAAHTETQLRRYEASFLTLFDTVTTVVGYAPDEGSFQVEVQKIHDELLAYHQLFDIYNNYPDINNIKSINDSAGGEPVLVDKRIIELLNFCHELAEFTDGCVDITMGSVLSIWHDARTEGINDPENAALPDPEALKEAAKHTGFRLLEIDTERSTVRLTDPDASLDVGAVAKGYAVARVCETAPEGFLISVGGNVSATGSKITDGSSWVVGVQKPDDEKNEYCHTLYVDDFSVVTSGDYQRYYTVGGKRYHHIIDPSTLYPANQWKAVTILCEDSGLADGLSTALFLMSMEDGIELLQEFDAEAMWVRTDGTVHYSDGFKDAIRT